MQTMISPDLRSILDAAKTQEPIQIAAAYHPDAPQHARALTACGHANQLWGHVFRGSDGPFPNGIPPEFGTALIALALICGVKPSQLTPTSDGEACPLEATTAYIIAVFDAVTTGKNNQ